MSLTLTTQTLCLTTALALSLPGRAAGEACALNMDSYRSSFVVAAPAIARPESPSSSLRGESEGRTGKGTEAKVALGGRNFWHQDRNAGQAGGPLTG